MKKYHKSILLIVLVLISISGCTQSSFTGYTTKESEEKYVTEEPQEDDKTIKEEPKEKISDSENLVTKVIDGDTIELNSSEIVRLIGINTPEKNQYYYSEAKNKLKELVERKTVILEKDISDKDMYDRLLRYIYVNGLFVNLEMVRLGYAEAYEYPPDTKYSSLLKEAENEAKENELGIWEKSEYKGCFIVSYFHYDAGGNDNYNLNDEYVTLGNICSYSIDMTGWTIKDETASHIYTFQSFVFQAKATFTLYTGTGENTNSALYWRRTPGNYAAIWNNNGDTLFLRDKEGGLILSYSY